MTSPTAIPVDRTPRLAYVGLFVAQFFIYANIRGGILDPGLYIGFRQPSATSAHAWAIFVQYWNHAMMFLFPVLALGMGVLLFGRVALLAISRFSRVRKIETSFINTFNLGVRGFLLPSVVTYALAKICIVHPGTGLIPFIADVAIFMSYSRMAMWKSLMGRINKKSQKAG